MNEQLFKLIRTQESLSKLIPDNAFLEKFAIRDNYEAIQKAISNISTTPLMNGLAQAVTALPYSNRLRHSTEDLKTPVAQYSSMANFSKPVSIIEQLKKSTKLLSVSDFVPVKNHLASISAATLFASSHLENMSAITNLLEQPNTSILSQSFPFSRYTQSYLIPDKSDVAFEDEIESHSGIIIKVGDEDIQSIINNFYQNEDLLKTISPRKFEEVIAELFRFHNYKVILTKQTRDGGFDMTIEKILANGTPFRALVECKRYNSKVAVDTVRCFSAVAYRQRVRHGIIVTSSFFTRDAEAECNGLPAALTLKNKNDVIAWAGSYVGVLPIVNLNLSKPQFQNSPITF